MSKTHHLAKSLCTSSANAYSASVAPVNALRISVFILAPYSQTKDQLRINQTVLKVKIVQDIPIKVRCKCLTSFALSNLTAPMAAGPPEGLQSIADYQVSLEGCESESQGSNFGRNSKNVSYMKLCFNSYYSLLQA